MPISLTPSTDIETADLAALVSRVLRVPAASIESLGGGRNSQVYRVVCADARRYVLKRYFNPQLDARNRMGVEFSSLQFLWDHGVRAVPQPIMSDPDQGWAMYAYVDGRHVDGRDLTEADIDDAARFLASLKALRCRQESRALPWASEACFSLERIMENIDVRLGRLSGHGDRETMSQALEAFLAEEFLPARDRIAQWCGRQVAANGGAFDGMLPEEHRTLSPSDFGFHNALRLRDGRFVYLDFEYFGWDDPAKIIADFVMHPAMALSVPHGRWFAAQLFRLFEEDRQLAKRAEMVYPLFGLKWCLILLNEFVPSDLQRRVFAGATTLQRDEFRMEQLAKARRMLRRILTEYEQFPYGL